MTISPLLWSALSLGCAQNPTSDTMSSDGMSSVAPQDTAEGTDLDLGNDLTITGIKEATIAYRESRPGVCEQPATFFLSYVESTSQPRLDFGLDFDTALPGTFAYDDVIETSTGTEGTGQLATYMVLVDESGIEPATAGGGTVEVDPVEGTATLTLSKVEFRGRDGVFGGSARVDLIVGCFYLVGSPEGEDGENGGDCGWLNDYAPAKTTFCQEATAGFSPDIVQ